MPQVQLWQQHPPVLDALADWKLVLPVAVLSPAMMLLAVPLSEAPVMR